MSKESRGNILTFLSIASSYPMLDRLYSKARSKCRARPIRTRDWCNAATMLGSARPDKGHSHVALQCNKRCGARSFQRSYSRRVRGPALFGRIAYDSAVSKIGNHGQAHWARGMDEFGKQGDDRLRLDTCSTHKIVDVCPSAVHELSSSVPTTYVRVFLQHFQIINTSAFQVRSTRLWRLRYVKPRPTSLTTLPFLFLFDKQHVPL